MSIKKVVLTLFLGIFMLAQSPGVVLAAAVSITGKAKVLNTNNSYLDFTNYNSNATVDNVTGNFSGYAFLEDVGWVAFGTTDNSLGPVKVNLTSGVVTGKAKSLNTGAYVDFTNYSSNVTANITTGAFSGYVFSEDVGWLNFSDTGVASTPPEVEIDSPSSLSYTNNQRPTIRWKAPNYASGSLTKYRMEFDNGDTGDFLVDSIPTSRTEKYETNRFVVNYDNFNDSDTDNNYISLYTKSSSLWGGSENDGMLKEGKRSVKVSAHDNTGNVKTGTRDFFVDLTAPSVIITQVNKSAFASNLATADTTPTIFGKITDSLAGDKTENKAAAGPKSVEVRFEKKNFSGLYDLHSLATVNLTESYWSDTGAKITDNNKNTADKYSTFSFAPAESLGLGTYRITITGKDNAGNTGALTSFSLRITTLAKIAPPKEKEIIEEIEKEPETVIEVPAEEAPVVQNIITRVAIALRDFYWKVVDSTKVLTDAGVKLAGNIATLWRAYSDFAQDINQKALVFVNTQLGKVGLASLTRAVSDIAQSTSKTLASAVAGLEKFIAVTTGPSIGKLLSIAEILFDKNPTVITNVKVAEVGKDYVVITWETNHYTTNNKVNYGESLSYGQNVLSQERARHHEFKIAGLETNKKYFFEVMSQNKNYVYDAHHEFTTLPE